MLFINLCKITDAKETDTIIPSGKDAKDFISRKHNPISTSSGSMTFPVVESNLLGWKRSIVPRVICHRIPSQLSSMRGNRGQEGGYSSGHVLDGVKTMYRWAI